MKCSECLKPLKGEELVYLNNDTSDTRSYCKQHKPDKSFPTDVKSAAVTLGRRIGGGSYEEPNVVVETQEVKELPEVIIDLPKIEEKDIVLTQSAIIEFKRFEEIKKTITENVAKYKGLVMKNDKDYDKFKKDITQLNKDTKLLNDIRIAIKKKVALPYDALEIQVKELVGIIGGAKSGLETQVSAYNLKVMEDKKNEIETEFNILLEEYPKVDFISLESVFDNKWLNKSPVIKKIIPIIENVFINLNSDIDMINLDENGARIKDVYLQNGFELADAKMQVLASIKRERENQARIDARMEANNLKANDKVIENIAVEVKREVANKVEQVTTTSKVTVKFSLSGDRDMVAAVINYIRESDVVLTQL